MRLLSIICILLLIAVPSHSEELIFFSGDHYKSLGAPLLHASLINPALMKESGVLRICLANSGELEELLPINGGGKREDIMQEMLGEMNCSYARNINAHLLSTDAIQTQAQPVHIERLPAGSMTEIQFYVTASKNASGWHDIPLRVEYERQVDVSVKDEKALPLSEAETENLTVSVFVPDEHEALSILKTGLMLYPGGSGSLMAAITNEGSMALHNCSASLIIAPPIHSDSQEVLLGDLPPGSIVVADFSVQVDPEASDQERQIGCEICCQEKRTIVTVPVTISGPMLRELWPIAASVLLAAVAITGIHLWKRGHTSVRTKRRLRP